MSCRGCLWSRLLRLLSRGFRYSGRSAGFSHQPGSLPGRLRTSHPPLRCAAPFALPKARGARAPVRLPSTAGNQARLSRGPGCRALRGGALCRACALAQRHCVTFSGQFTANYSLKLCKSSVHILGATCYEPSNDKGWSIVSGLAQAMPQCLSRQGSAPIRWSISVWAPD